MAISFNENYYLEQKLAQLQQQGEAFNTVAEVAAAFAAAGLTAQQHYAQFGAEEGLNPSPNFQTELYLEQKLAQLQAAGETHFDSPSAVLAAITAAGLSPLEHYNQFGAFEGVSPNASFNVPAYLADKLALLQSEEATAAEWATKGVAEVLAAFQAAGLTPLEHFQQYGVNEGLTAKPVGPVPGETFTLTAALQALAAANKAKADFLDEQELADDNAADSAVKAADSLVANFGYAPVSAAGEVGSSKTVYDTDDSAGVKAAKLADAQAQLDTNLANLTKLLDAAKAEVAAVTGLTSAINAFNSRVATLESAEEAELQAEATQAAALATLNTLKGGEAVTVESAGVVDDFIIVGADGKLKLADGIAAALQPAATTLLNAINARIAAEATTAAAELAVKNALLTVGYLDFAADRKDDIGAAFRAELTQAQTDALTRTQVQNELNAQKAIAMALTGEDGIEGVLFDEASGLFGSIVGEGEDAAFIAFGADGADETPEGAEAAEQYNALKTAVDAFHAAILKTGEDGYTLEATVLLAAQLGAQEKVDDAAQAIADLTELLGDLADAKAVAAELADLNAAIAAAEKAFDDAGFEVPVTLDGLTIASGESDIYLVGSDNAEIVNFGAEGNDLLFFGTNYSFVVLGATESLNQRVGDANALEVFAKQNGSNVELFVEQQAFAGNALNDTATDIVKIVLAGVNVDDLAFADGAITLA